MLPWHAFPVSFRNEVEAWTVRLSGENLLDEGAPIKPLRPSTLETRRFQIRQLASALVQQGYHCASPR